MDGFKTFDETVIKCQNEENYDDCKTRKYVDALKKQAENGYSCDLPKMAR